MKGMKEPSLVSLVTDLSVHKSETRREKACKVHTIKRYSSVCVSMQCDQSLCCMLFETDVMAIIC